MKKMIMIAAGILFILIHTGCSADSKSSTGSENVQSTKTAVSNVQSESEAEPQPRIIATTVAITQIMNALGVDLVGIPTSTKTLPERYKDIKKIGNPMSPDMELVKSLKPTDVLSVTTLQYDLEPVFESVKINATFLDLTSLSRMQAAISELGQKYGHEREAKEIVQAFDDKIADIQMKIANKEKPKVLILLGVPGSYLVATENSYIGDLVKLAGGVNIVQGENVEFLASNTEYLQQANPDVILRAAHGMPVEVIEMFDKEFKKNDVWKHFNAVKNNRVYDLEEELFGTTGGLNASDALDVLVEMLYP